MVGCLRQRQPHVAGELGRHRGAEAGRRVEARCPRPCRRSAAARRGAAPPGCARPPPPPGRRSRRAPGPSVTGVASMRWVRPAFTTSAWRAAWSCRVAARCSQRGQQLHAGLADRGDVDRRREHVVGRLRRVHLVVRVDRPARAARRRGWRSPRSCSCSSTCPTRSGRRRSGTGRPTGPGRPRRRRRGSPWPRPRPARPALGSRPTPAPLIDASAPISARSIRSARDGEVLHRPLRLGPPSGRRRHPHLPHRVVLDAELVSHHDPNLRCCSDDRPRLHRAAPARARRHPVPAAHHRGRDHGGGRRADVPRGGARGAHAAHAHGVPRHRPLAAPRPPAAAAARSSTTRRRRPTTASSPSTCSRTPTSPPAASCRCARTPAPPS